jgi:two-component system chemotaxis response regulator CheB
MARDGQEGIDKALELLPDLITMDFNMPGVNGAQAVREIMKKRPTPIIMFSAHTTQGARETFEALAAGAVDFVTKPSGEVSATLAGAADELLAKGLAAAGARPQAIKPAAKVKTSLAALTATWPPSGPRVVLIGVSTGGPAALSRVIPALPGSVRFGIVIVQHMPAKFTAALADRLDALSTVKVREAKAGDKPSAGLVLIAPGDKHLEIGEGGIVQLTDGKPVNGCRPSADVTMKSAARVFGRRAVGVVMTGMGKDGAAGLAAIKEVSGQTIAQDQATSVIFGMPKAAIDAGVVDKIVPLDGIAAALEKI